MKQDKKQKFKLPFGVMTFEPVPVMFFSKKIRTQNKFIKSKKQLKKLKLDFLAIIKFNKTFSSLSAEQFIKEIIFKKTKCRYLYVSRNFKFGFKRRGNIKTLKKFENSLIIKIL